MEKHRLGRTNLEVTRIGLGGMTIPGVSKEQAVETVNKALDLGINFIDTARAYGDSEEKIGEVMRNRRKQCFLSSRSPQVSYDGMKKDIETSLKSLLTDYIDLYEPHDLSTAAKYEELLSKKGALEALKEAQREGKIRFIGFTGHNWKLIKKLIQTDEFDAALITYNIVSRDAEEEVIPLAKDHDVGLFVMKVFGNSRLLKLTPRGEKRSPTVEECLRFALSNRDLSMILTGVKSPEEITQNVSIAETYVPLTIDQKRELTQFGDKLGRGYCYGCEYCLPCPAEINIPGILRLLDCQERANWEWPQLRQEYKKFERTMDECTDCGQCEESCPQNLPIREELKKAKEKLDREV